MHVVPDQGERELICLLLFTCNNVVSVRRGFLFLWVLGWAALFYCGTAWPLVTDVVTNICVCYFCLETEKVLETHVQDRRHHRRM